MRGAKAEGASTSPAVCSRVATLNWLLQSEGTGGGGGFFATYPATDDRVAALGGYRIVPRRGANGGTLGA